MKEAGINITNLKSALRARKRKTISLSELAELFLVHSDEELYGRISAAEAEGLISPVMASGTNGNLSYPLHLRYRIAARSGDDDHTAELSEIALLHPVLTRTGYLSARPEHYISYKGQLQALNTYLFRSGTSVPVSRKERSFEIFGEEKQLEDRNFVNLLERLGITADTLLCYDTPEYCFNDYIPSRKREMTLLICENKDIWFNIRRRMYEDGADEILHTHIDGVVYGCGNRISGAGALAGYTVFTGAESVRYLYWGDIDRAGLNIYLSLIRNNPELDIRIFAPGYRMMLELAEEANIPHSMDHRELVYDYEAVYRWLDDEDRARMAAYIEANMRIPQEIVNYGMLIEIMN